MVERTRRVLISGAGIAGPVLAHFLSRTRRFQVTVVEKAPRMLDQGQNIDIRGTALNIIKKKMGLLEQVQKYNTTEKGTRVIDDEGRVRAELTVEGSLFTPTSEFEILRGDLANVLYNGTKDAEGIEYRFGTSVEEVTENDDEHVKVRFSDGKEEEEFNLLVAADGQWSNIRKQVFPASDLTVVDKRCFFVYWTVPKTPQDENYWDLYNAINSRSVGTRPDPHGTTRAYVSAMPLTPTQASEWIEAARSHDKKRQIDFVRRQFADVGWKTPRLLPGLDDAPDLYFQALQQIRLAKWYQNRVICLGDAAYAPTPMTGMGTSLAIDGAYLLAGHLSQLETEQHPKEAFEAYDNEFRPFVEKIQQIPSFVPGIMHPQTAWKIWLHRTVFSVLSAVCNLPLLVRWMKGKKKEEFGKGLVDPLDAPYPQFPAFETAQTAQ